MAGLLIVTSPGGSLGFRLGGFHCRELEGGGELAALLKRVADEGRYGLVCVDSALLEEVDPEVMRRIDKRGVPIVMPLKIPAGWEEVEPGETHIARLIHRAVGYHIKIKR
ncbi:MAG TPA: hypothetical protein ENJ37_02805 [Deltaproteobacteria bacterium]|nr:hypothetical protein [Deltaproteobacteria bacterium]